MMESMLIVIWSANLACIPPWQLIWATIAWTRIMCPFKKKRISFRAQNCWEFQTVYTHGLQVWVLCSIYWPALVSGSAALERHSWCDHLLEQDGAHQKSLQEKVCWPWHVWSISKEATHSWSPIIHKQPNWIVASKHIHQKNTACFWDLSFALRAPLKQFLLLFAGQCKIGFS